MAKPFRSIMLSLKPKRRWAQFSLGTMLLLVTMLCAVLAMIVVPAERQRRAAGLLEAAGAGLQYDPWFPGPEPFPKRTLRRWLPRDCFDKVVSIRLASSGPFAAPKPITNAELASVRALSDLEELFLVGTDVTDAGLAHLRPLTRLKKLGLANTRITDIGLSHVERKESLSELWLTNTAVTDAGLLHLCALTRLEILGLNGTHLTDAGLAQLGGLKSLRSLSLTGTQVTACGLARLQQALPKCEISGP